MIGRVVSDKMTKSVTVVLEGKKVHPLYKKSFIRSKKLIVDDLLGVKIGDLVEIIKVAPVSKNKHFRIVKVVGKNLEEVTKEKLKEQAEEVVSEVMPEEKTEELSVVSPQTEKEANEKPKKPRKKKEAR